MLTAFDVGVGVLVLISAILATARGLTREVLSLATWAGAAALAAYMFFEHKEIARGYIQDPTIADIATVLVTFIVALIVLHLITMRIADFVVDSRIGPLDRTLGFVFGVLRGIVIAVVVVIMGDFLNWAGFSAQVEPSKTLPPLRSVGDSLIAALPPDLEKQVTDFLQRGDNEPTTDAEGGDPEAGTVPDEGGTDAGEDGTVPDGDAPPTPTNTQTGA